MKVKKFVLAAIIGLISIGVCGCMKANVDEKQYQKEILEYLNQKYSDDFSILKMYHEFDGNNGMYVRALCKSNSYEDEFTVYCYMDSDREGDVLEIEGENHVMEDAYSEVLFQNQFLEQLKYDKNAEYIVRCNIDFTERKPTIAEIREGFEKCAKNNDLRMYIKTYVITAGTDESKEVQKRLEDLISQIQPYTGYVYLAEKMSYEKKECEKVYSENQHDFGNYLYNRDFADKVELTVYYAKNGLQDRKIIKE